MLPTGLVGLLAAVVIGCLLSIASGHRVEIIDGLRYTTQSAAEFVCDPNPDPNRQLGHIDTVHYLHVFFSNPQVVNQLAGRKFAPCATRLGPMMEELDLVLNRGNSDVCSVQKIEAIESFHRRFVAQHTGQTELKVNVAAPKQLAALFMHYATEVGVICRQHLGQVLTTDPIAMTELKRFEKTPEVERLENYLDIPKVKALEHILRGRDMENHLINAFRPIKNKFDVILGRHKTMPQDAKDQLLAKVGPKSHVAQVQEQCQNKVRPIYSKTIEPIIRLANLGYSGQAKQLAQTPMQPKGNDMIQKWAELTQTCEMLLAIKLFLDPKLGEGALSMISKEEANQLMPIQIDARYERDFVPQAAGITGEQVRKSVISEGGQIVSSIEPDNNIKPSKIKSRAKPREINLIEGTKDKNNKVKPKLKWMFESNPKSAQKRVRDPWDK